MPESQKYHLYILLCDQSILYTGIAIDPIKRLQEHQSGKPPGAKFTRRFDELKLVYQIAIGSRSDAQIMEAKIKKLKKNTKLKIINSQADYSELLQIIEQN